MATWGTEQAYSEGTVDDYRLLNSGRMVGANGGRYQPSFFNDDLNDIFVNLVNDIEFVAGTPAAAIIGVSMFFGCNY